MPKNFAIIGVGGYIAPRHLNAIKETGNEVVAALDPSDSVGIIDRYFENVHFFTEFERFDRHVELHNRKNGEKIDYVTICSPNYLHDSHIRFGLRHGANVICEKPLVLNPWNVDLLIDLEKETGKNVYTILQLREHPAILALKEEVEAAPKDKVFDIDLTYLTPRGNWYQYSWKGNLEKSGGIATNIGIHFFDMLMWIFGDLKSQEVHLRTNKSAAGFLELERANVRWYLSIDKDDLPKQNQETRSPYRSILIDNKELEFSGGFTDLHTLSYQQILNGKGYRINDARAAISTVHEIRTLDVHSSKEERMHPMVKKRLQNTSLTKK